MGRMIVEQAVRENAAYHKVATSPDAEPELHKPLPYFISRFFIAVATSLLIWVTTFQIRRYNDPILNEHISACTYSDLIEAYPPRSTRPDKSVTCWSLEQEILRIPSSVLHRHHLSKLGAGGRGAVFKAIIELPQGKMCAVAVKTDHCFTPTTALRQRRQTGHSCLEPHAFFQKHPKSYLGGEYSGAAMFHAQRHANITAPGLLPTWAIIEDVGNPTPMVGHQRSDMEGMPHPNPDIKAVVMPLVDFTPLADLSKWQLRSLIRNASSIARAMLPAAAGMSLVSGMRFAYRDVTASNIGILAGSNRALIFDNSFMVHQDDASCQLNGDIEKACNYCMDPAFAHISGVDEISSDMSKLRKIILSLLDESPDQSIKMQNLIADLYNSKDIRSVVDALRAAQ